jgi:hypothetical protein
MAHRLARGVAHVALGATFVVLAASRAQAQALRLRAASDSAGMPIHNAVVEVLDTAGIVAGRGILSSTAWRVFPLPAAGQYRVRVRRVGFEPFDAAPPVIRGRDTVSFTLTLPTRRVTLSTITVRARPACSRDALRDPAVYALWTEIGTALTTTLLGRADSSLTLEARAFHRRLGSRFAIEDERVGLPRLSTGAAPYYALTAEELANGGYVRQKGTETTYFVPDEAVLLSRRFTEEHCFQVTRGEGETEGLIGLRFTPPRQQDVNDIAGTLWVDSSSAELRFLDFWYVSDAYPFAAPGEGRGGGQVLFGRALDGAWIVSAWRLRMPRFADGRTISARSDPDWYEEVGGVVTALAADTLLPLGIAMPYRDLLAPSRVSGVVFDSLTGHPLAGARVWLLPEDFPEDVAYGLAPSGGRPSAGALSQLADSSGSFALADLPAGTWRLAFEHPSLDSVGVRGPSYDIRLRPGASVSGVLAVPSLATLRAGCAGPAGATPTASRGMISGIVRAAGDDRVLVGALVRASWVDLQRASPLRRSAAPVMVETHTDSLGAYRLCGVSDSTEVTVVAAGPHSTTGEVRLMIGRLQLARVNLRLAEVAEGDAAPPAGTVAGSVTDSIGNPVAAARVSLDGSTVTVLTDATGRFLLPNVQPGTQSIEVRRVGLDPARTVVDVAPGATTPVALTLSKAHLLYTVVVTASRVRSMPGVAEAIDRQRFGVGRLLLEDQIRNVPTFESLLQNVSGLRVVANETGGPWVALMRRGVGECVARPFVDGREVDYDVISTLKPKDIAALEVYVHGALAPVFTSVRSIYGRDETCGVILIWEKHQV